MSKKGEKLLNIRKTEVTDDKESNRQRLRRKFYRSYRPRYRHNNLRFLALTYIFKVIIRSLLYRSLKFRMNFKVIVPSFLPKCNPKITRISALSNKQGA